MKLRTERGMSQDELADKIMVTRQAVSRWENGDTVPNTDKKTRLLRVGIYLFTIMEWVSAVGFGMFPLSDSGYAGTFQDKMHIFSTVIVVLLSIVSLDLIIIAGAKDKSSRSYGIFAAIALGMMMVGAMGMNIVPKDYFGIVERFSVFAATGYNAVLGIELYRMKF